MNNDFISFLPLGGIGDVTRNMYLYEYQNQILIVDCGLGFPDETMLGVDLLLPDISYLLSLPKEKQIVGMVLTHGHEDHIGGLPFLLPQLPTFPIYASPLTAAFANEKLKEFQIGTKIQTVSFDNPEVTIGVFKALFIRVTHSVPDSANILIKTPIGALYHGSDFKFDLTPWDNKKTDFQKIARAGSDGIICLMSDCLGAERPGQTPTEAHLADNFEAVARTCSGKLIITTYSSNISRLNQAITVAKKMGRKVCFVGRSLVKVKEIGQRLSYLQLDKGMEVAVEDIRKFNDKDLLLLVAGSQGQENSALSRIANGEHRDIRLSPQDVVVFSSDTIPGNETSVYGLIDALAKKSIRVVYSGISHDFHVSGHGSAEELKMLMTLTSPRFLCPISGTYRHMVAYKKLAETLGYKQKDIFLIEDGQELLISRDRIGLGKKIAVRNVFVDQITGEELESFVLRDRQKLSDSGIVVVMVEVDTNTGQMLDKPDIVIRGLSPTDNQQVIDRLTKELRITLGSNRGRVTNWVHLRRLVGEVAEKAIFREIRRRPLVLPIIIEV